MPSFPRQSRSVSGASRILLAACSTALLASCGAPDSASDASASADSGIEVTTCGTTVTLPGAPERVALLNNAPVLTLHELGVLDRTVVRAGVFSEEYYAERHPEVLTELEAIPSLTDRVDESGHLRISLEPILDADPDVVLGSTDTINTQTMADRAPVIQEEGFCGLGHDASFDDVLAEVRLYGQLFHREERAEDYVAELSERISAVESEATDMGQGRSVAVLYPTPGGTVTYAYGRSSMSYPLTEAAGLRNVFADAADRVFEVTPEELVNRNPDLVLVLHSSVGAEEAIDALRNTPGAEDLADRAIPLSLSYAEPPTPLAVDGLELLTQALKETASA